MSLGFSDSIKQVYQSILSETSPTTWALFGYEKANSNQLKVISSGEGGVDELEEEWEDSKVLFAFLKVMEPISKLFKYVLISWCGDGVPVAKKGLFHTHVNDATRYFQGFHVHINARAEIDVTSEAIMKKVKDASGAKYSIHNEKNKAMSAADVNGPISALQSKSKFSTATPTASYNANIANTIVNNLNPVGNNKSFSTVNSKFNGSFSNQPATFEAPKANIGIIPARTSENKVGKNINVFDSQKPAFQEKKSSFSVPTRPDESENHPTVSVSDSRKTSFQEKRASFSIPNRPQEPSQSVYMNASANAFLSDSSAPSQESRNSVAKERERREAEERERASKENEARELAEKARERREIEERERVRLENEERIRTEERIQIENASISERARNQLSIDQEKLERSFESQHIGGNTYVANNDLPRAVALYSYDAAETNEISFLEGEIITDINQIEGGWWQGSLANGSIGLFPSNYVEIIQENSSIQNIKFSKEIPQAESNSEPEVINQVINNEIASGASVVALYDYSADEENELSFSAGQTIIGISFVSDDWWQGTIDGVTGLCEFFFTLVPGNYVKLE